MTAPERRPLLLLSGFMGTGKSTLGRALADQTGATFEDLDAALEVEAGCTIAELFAEHGEAAFRDLERARLVELLASECDGARIVALGGGTLVDPESRRRALEGAFVVTLVAEVDTIVARCAGSARPLLASMSSPEEAAQRVRALMQARAEAYEAGHLHVTTDGQPPEALARALAARWVAVDR
ncbi:MAG TPA: shikimate kinase [Polyangiaceae bacterium]|nr:shikimate kinase [Polyangiaceae bacterium]